MKTAYFVVVSAAMLAAWCLWSLQSSMPTVEGAAELGLSPVSAVDGASGSVVLEAASPAQKRSSADEPVGGDASSSAEAGSEVAGVERAEAKDAFGLTRSQKLEYLMNAHANLMGSVNGVPDHGLLRKEWSFASRCAVTILREQGEGKSQPDVTKDGRPGFRAATPQKGTFEVFADSGKFVIEQGRFPAFDFAQERLKLVNIKELQAVLPSLTKDQIVMYEHFYRDALAALGVP